MQFPMEASFLCSAATYTLRAAGTLNTPHSTRLVFFLHSFPDAKLVLEKDFPESSYPLCSDEHVVRQYAFQPCSATTY